jgi:hypothetical protein
MVNDCVLFGGTLHHDDGTGQISGTLGPFFLQFNLRFLPRGVIFLPEKPLTQNSILRFG